MKQYTTPEQTAKLIDLGFEKPINTIVKEDPIYREGSIIDWKPIAEEGSYSIGELIEMLPDVINILHHAVLKIETTGLKWHVKYEGDRGVEYLTYNTQLIDALYDMVTLLKEEGAI